jgi:hypothetical protein
MATTTQTPQQIVEDRKVAGLLDDLFDDCLDADKTAKKLSSGETYRSMSPDAQSAFDKDWDALLSALDASEKERDVCLAGKAKDTRKLKSLIQAQLDALSVLELAIGRVEVLEDAAAGKSLNTAVSAITAVMGVAAPIALVQKDLADLYKALQKATTAARDAKVKAAVSAGTAAIGVCLASFSAPVSITGAVVLFTVRTAVGAAFNGTEDSTVKKTWGVASGATSAAKALFGLSDAIGPALILVSGAVDISECFAAEREKADVLARITAMKRTFDTTIANAAKLLDELGKACAEAESTLRDAVAAVKAVRVPTPQCAAVMRYL